MNCFECSHAWPLDYLLKSRFQLAFRTDINALETSRNFNKISPASVKAATTAEATSVVLWMALRRWVHWSISTSRTSEAWLLTQYFSHGLAIQAVSGAQALRLLRSHAASRNGRVQGTDTGHERGDGSVLALCKASMAVTLPKHWPGSLNLIDRARQ